MIELQQVSLKAGSFTLTNLNLKLEPGEHAVLMGRTGQGKTTILEAICGLRDISSGKILLAGTDVTQHDPADRKIGYVPQDLALFPTLSVREHLAFAPTIRRMPPSEIAARVTQLAELLGITPLLDRPVQGLSGGEAQRVALGRALAAEPPVLLLDEPFSALDDETRIELRTVLKRVQQQTGVTILHVTHNRQDADALADRIFRLDGTIHLHPVPAR